jgi:DNA-binding PadR family transcriptional regulator
MAARRRAVSNPLALAVLATLRQAPMHPYEMAATMRSQGKEHSIKLNYGSLYTVVDNLARHGFVEAVEARREGRRPERTVYQLTAAGQAELDDWMSELIAVPVKEYPQFEAALAELGVLPPAQVLPLLRERVAALEKHMSGLRAEVAGLPWLPRLFMLETEYHLAMQEAELAWVRALAAEFEDGSFPGLSAWQYMHDHGELPPELSELHVRLASPLQQIQAERAERRGGGTPPAAQAGQEAPSPD